jgi:hypothetical protein
VKGSARKGLPSKERVKSGVNTGLKPDADALELMVDGLYHCPYAAIPAPCCYGCEARQLCAATVAACVQLCPHTGWFCVMTAGRSASASSGSRQRYIPIQGGTNGRIIRPAVYMSA